MNSTEFRPNSVESQNRAHHHVRGRGRRRRHSLRSAAAAQRRGTRRRGPSHRRNHARSYRRHRRNGMDMPAAALPRPAGPPFRGRSGSACRPEPLGFGRRRIHSPRRTRQTDGWSWAVEGGDQAGGHVAQQLPRERASWRRRRRQRHGHATSLVVLLVIGFESRELDGSRCRGWWISLRRWMRRRCVAGYLLLVMEWNYWKSPRPFYSSEYLPVDANNGQAARGGV